MATNFANHEHQRERRQEKMVSTLKEYYDDHHKALMTADMEFWKHHQKLLQDSEHLISLPLLLNEVKAVCSGINMQNIANIDKTD